MAAPKNMKVGEEKFTDHPVRHWRKSRSMSAGDLARELHITTAHLSQIEHRKGRCSFDLALELSRVTGIPVEKLYSPRKQVDAPKNTADH